MHAVRQRAAKQVHDLLGIDVETDQLLDLAKQTLGGTRADRCAELAGRARLTRRSMACASVAELIVAGRRLGTAWWNRQHRDMNPQGAWEAVGMPESLLNDCDTAMDPLGVGSALGLLGMWACDDAADDEWGRPVAYVDLNDPHPDDRVTIPADAIAGDRLVASFDAGCRVWAEVVERDEVESEHLVSNRRRRGSLGTVLVEHHCCDAAEAGWAWGLATSGELVRLPGEAAGTKADPYARLISNTAARRLYEGAIELGASVGLLGERWKTSGELLEAAYRLGLPYELPGQWAQWGRSMAELVDETASQRES
jgi:hypothetical protein